MAETAGKQRGRPFRKGQTGNPNGRPRKTPEVREVEELCKELGPMAVERLAHWARSKDPAASVRACQAILDRGFGKAAQPVDSDVTVRMVVNAPQPIESPEDWAAKNAPTVHH